MSRQVSFQIPLLGELFLTVRTLERLHPVVAERVPLQAIHRDEALRTRRAQVRPLPRVGARVHVQVALGGEALPAVRAGVRRLARVGPDVQQQLPGGQKRLPACGAQVILLPFVHLHVSRNSRFAEAFPADVAQVGGASVQALVLLQRIVAQEALVALAADKYPASLVDPLVLIITRRAGEPFFTLGAAVREAVKLHVSRQLIWKFKNLFTLQALCFRLCEVFVDVSHAQKPFVFPHGLVPPAPRLVFQVVLLHALTLIFNAAFLLAFPFFS